jgi:hypothetical protein
MNPGSVSIAVQPMLGTAVANGDGTITYTPTVGFSGSDDLVYRACDNGNHCGTAVVALSVIPTTSSGGPIGLGLSAVTQRNSAITSSVESVVVPGTAPIDPTTITVLTTPANGTAMVNGDGTITYTPAHDYIGTDSYAYQACDTNSACTFGTVALTVTEH